MRELLMAVYGNGRGEVATSVSKVQKALCRDLAVLQAAKESCVSAVDLSFTASKDSPPDEDKVVAALAALEQCSARFGPVGAEHRAHLKAAHETILAEHATCEQLMTTLRAGMLADPVEEIDPEKIDTAPLKAAIASVQAYADALLASAPHVRGLTDSTRLLQAKNRHLIKASAYVARLRDALQHALRISDTTQQEKFAEAKVAWDGIQRLLLEATSVEGLAELDVDDLSSARQLMLKRSVMSDVKEKLIEAAANQWEDWLEFSLYQAEQLGLDYHEEQAVRDAVANARVVYANIMATKQAIADAIAETDRRSAQHLRLALAAAKRINWQNPKVDEAVALEARVTQASAVAHAAWQQLDRNVLKKAVSECEGLVDSEDVNLCKFLLAGQEKAYLQKALRLFQFLGRSDLVSDITMAMKDMFFANAGEMFALKHFPMLRSSEEYGRASSTMGFRNHEVADGMLLWSLKLPTSLTKVSVAKTSQESAELLKKILKQLWQCIQGYMGDIVLSYPSMLAQEVLRIAIEYPPLKDEIYCLILKQLTKNPNPASEAKGYDLMQICLRSFSPSDVFVNYLEYFLRTTGNEGLVKTLHQMTAEQNLADKKLTLAEIGQVTGLVVHTGWLQVRSEGVFNSYTKYWFLIDPEAGRLRYFLQEVDLKKNLKQKQLRSVDIGQITSLDELEPSEKASRNPSIRGKWPFELGMAGAAGKKLRLVSDTLEDRTLWIQALRAAKANSWQKAGGGEEENEE